MPLGVKAVQIIFIGSQYFEKRSHLSRIFVIRFIVRTARILNFKLIAKMFFHLLQELLNYQEEYSEMYSYQRLAKLLFCIISIFSPLTLKAVIGGADLDPSDKLARSAVGIFEKYLNRTWITNCFGSVVEKRLILTAAHCLSGDNQDHPENFAINFSTDQIVYDSKNEITELVSIENQFIIRKVKKLIVHPKFDGKKGSNDIALIVLEDDAPEGAIDVNFFSEELFNQFNRFKDVSHRVTLVAGGSTNEKTYTKSVGLQAATLSARIEDQFVITDQSAAIGACKGDSGGPAFTDFKGIVYQIGVISKPHGNSKTCHEEGELVNPYFYIEFIMNVKRELLN